MPRMHAPTAIARSLTFAAARCTLQNSRADFYASTHFFPANVRHRSLVLAVLSTIDMARAKGLKGEELQKTIKKARERGL